MSMDKKDIALTVGGIMAGLTLTYLLYRLEQNNAATAQADAVNQAAETESSLANQQAQIASLPSVSVPSLSTPSSTDTSLQATSPATDSNLAAIIAAFQTQDNSSVTSQSSPVGSIPVLSLPSQIMAPPVDIPYVAPSGSIQAYGAPVKPNTNGGVSVQTSAYSNPIAPIVPVQN